MLVLSRKVMETVVLRGLDDQEVRVTVVDVRGDKAWLSFDAPLSVRIDREEIDRAKQGGGDGKAK